MTGFQKFIYFLQFRGQPVHSYGWFHFLFIAITIASIVLLCIYCKNSSKKTHKIILLVFWLIMLLFEIYKQIVFSLSVVDGVAEWKYRWFSFPFQFCSSPIYILPFAIFIKSEKWTDWFESFLCTFSLFAGFAVMCFPGDVLSSSFIGVSVQTMIHHGGMVALGIYLLVRNRQKLTYTYFMKGVVPFIALVCVAFVLNETMVFVATDTFNMFFISRHFGCSLPILDVVFNKAPYSVFLFVYVAGFSFVAFVVFNIAKLVQFVAKKIKNKKTADK